MRERMIEERASKYTHAFIRVQFSDRNVLQGAFRPQETGITKHDEYCIPGKYFLMLKI